jgi:hypothetical protein
VNESGFYLSGGFSLVVFSSKACGKSEGLSTSSGTGSTYVVVVCRDVMCYVRLGFEFWPFDVRQTFYVLFAAYLQYELQQQTRCH